MNRGRTAIIAAMIAGLVVAGIARDRSIRQRHDDSTTSVGRGIGSLSSYALALMLGGLRGPLVMILWASSETQKTTQDLDDFDTKIEWIRMLQPEFDSVHLFQIWNKSYNISAQMSSLVNKYTTILDAIEYARKVDQERPNNISIAYALGQTYAQKLGDSLEKAYFRNRVRKDTLPHEQVGNVARGDPGWRPLALDPMLDADGNILPQFLQPTSGSPAASRPANATEVVANDGSELQYLAPFQPFKYGISPMALGYNYFRQAQSLARIGKQQHVQLSDIVVDGRPSVGLRLWAVEEKGRGRRAEARAFGFTPVQEPNALEIQTAAADKPISSDRADYLEALDAYSIARKVMADAILSYGVHHQRHPENRSLHRSHIEDLQAEVSLMIADEAYLRLVYGETPDTPEARRKVADAYQEAANAYRRIILRYYIAEPYVPAAFPPGVTRANVDEIPAESLAEVVAKVDEQAKARFGDPNADTREEYDSYLRRIEVRRAILLGQPIPADPAESLAATQPVR